MCIYIHTRTFHTGKPEIETGWEMGLRACLPIAEEGRIASHGDVVQWGECVCVILSDPLDTSWSLIVSLCVSVCVCVNVSINMRVYVCVILSDPLDTSWSLIVSLCVSVCV